MDTTRDTSNHEKLIEDYLFSGYQPKPLQVSFDDDQQFAQPIEDEDMFGSIECDKGTVQTASKGSISQMKEKYKELAKNIKPVEYPADCDEDGMIDFEIEVEKPEPKSNAKLIFERAALRRVKDKYGLYKGQKLFWDRYHDYLLGKLSADKRKRWESFQNPPDRYNDEEELIDELDDHSEKSESGDENELDELLNDGDNAVQEDDAERMSYTQDTPNPGANEDSDGEEGEMDEEDQEDEEDEAGGFDEEGEDGVSDDEVDKPRGEPSKSPEPDYQKLFADKSKWINEDDSDEDHEVTPVEGNRNGGANDEVADKETDHKVNDSDQGESSLIDQPDDAFEKDAGSAASECDEDEEANALDFDELESESEFDDDSNAN